MSDILKHLLKFRVPSSSLHNYYIENFILNIAERNKCTLKSIKKHSLNQRVPFYLPIRFLVFNFLTLEIQTI